MSKADCLQVIELCHRRIYKDRHHLDPRGCDDPKVAYVMEFEEVFIQAPQMGAWENSASVVGGGGAI